MSVFRKKMPNGNLTPTFHYRFMVDGRIYTGSTGCTTEREAKKFERKTISQLRQQSSVKGLVENFRDVLAGGKTISLEEAFDAFAAKPKKREPGPRALKNHHARWEDFLAFVAAKYPTAKKLSDVNIEIAEAYVKYIRAFGKFNKEISYRRNGHRRDIVFEQREETKLSPRTCNYYHATCQQVFGILFQDASLIVNPFAKIPKLKNVYAGREAFTPEELKLIGETADDFVYPLFAISINTGLREGDVCTLRWDEIDLINCWINRKMLKTGEAVRVPILPPLRGYLESLQNDSEYVLPQHAKMYHNNPSGISYRVSRFLESEPVNIKKSRVFSGRTRRVSVKDIHSCRHTFCYLAAVHGVPLPIVQSIVGHVDERLTQMYSNHASDEVKKIKMTYVPDYLGLPSGGPERGPGVESKDDTLIKLLKSMNTRCWKKSRDKALALLEPDLAAAQS